MCHANAISFEQARPISAMDTDIGIDAAIIAAAVRAWDPMLTVEQHDSYDFQQSIIISGATDTVIIVDRDPAGIRVSSMHDDAFQAGEVRFQSLMDALDAIRPTAFEMLAATDPNARFSQPYVNNSLILEQCS